MGRNLNLPKNLTLSRLIRILKTHERNIGVHIEEYIKDLKVISDNIAITYSNGENKWVTRKL